MGSATARPSGSRSWASALSATTDSRSTSATAFLREFVVKSLLFGFVGGFFFSIPTLLDCLWPLWDDSDRCLHDMVVTTHVVRKLTEPSGP